MTTRALSALTRITSERDAAVSWIRTVGEELFDAGLPTGDRDQTLANVRLLIEQRDALVSVAKEIADDPKCNLVDSERRIRLYAAITKAGAIL
jgi:hypothetical protein